MLSDNLALLLPEFGEWGEGWSYLVGPFIGFTQ